MAEQKKEKEYVAVFGYVEKENRDGSCKICSFRFVTEIANQADVKSVDNMVGMKKLVEAESGAKYDKIHITCTFNSGPGDPEKVLPNGKNYLFTISGTQGKKAKVLQLKSAVPCYPTTKGFWTTIRKFMPGNCFIVKAISMKVM